MKLPSGVTIVIISHKNWSKLIKKFRRPAEQQQQFDSKTKITVKSGYLNIMEQ